MEEALKSIDARAAIVSDESGMLLASYAPESERESLYALGQEFVSLDKLALNLRMGPLTQLVKVKDTEVELTTRHAESHSVSVVTAGKLDKAFAAESTVSDLLEKC